MPTTRHSRASAPSWSVWSVGKRDLPTYRTHVCAGYQFDDHSSLYLSKRYRRNTLLPLAIPSEMVMAAGVEMGITEEMYQISFIICKCSLAKSNPHNRHNHYTHHLRVVHFISSPRLSTFHQHTPSCTTSLRSRITLTVTTFYYVSTRRREKPNSK